MAPNRNKFVGKSIGSVIESELQKCRLIQDSEKFSLRAYEIFQNYVVWSTAEADVRKIHAKFHKYIPKYFRISGRREGGSSF